MAAANGRLADLIARLGADELLDRLRTQLKGTYRFLRARYQKLEPREKVLVQIASVLLTIFLVYNLLYLPVVSLGEDQRARISGAERELGEVGRLVGNYRQLRADLARVERRTVPQSKDFSLFSVLEQTLTQSVGHDKIGSITPSERRIANELTQYAVDLKLVDISLQQLVDALYGIKSLSVPVTISNITIKKRFQNPHLFEVEMNCFALGKNG